MPIQTNQHCAPLCGWPVLVLQKYYRRQDLGEERDCWNLQREVVRQKSLRSKRLHSIPEVAEDEPDGVDGMGHHHQRLRFDDEGRPGTPCMHRRSPRIYQQDPHQHNHLSPSKNHRRLLQRQHSSPRYGCNFEERSLNRPSRQTTKSPDSGLDCGSEEEGSLGYRGYPHGSPMRGPVHYIHCEGPVERQALAAGRKRQLTRQCSMDEDYCDSPKTGHLSDLRNREVHYGPTREPGQSPRHGALSEGRLHELDRAYHRDLRASYVNRLNRVSDQPLVCVTQTLICCIFHQQAVKPYLFSWCFFFYLYGSPTFTLIYFCFVQYSGKLFVHVHGDSYL